MAAPSKNISASLRGQRSPGRGEEQITVASLHPGPSMTVPGEGGIEMPPGPEHERCAAKYAAPMSRYGGR